MHIKIRSLGITRKQVMRDLSRQLTSKVFPPSIELNLYNLNYRRFGVRDGCGIIFGTAKDAVFFLGALSDREITDRQKALLNSVAAHLVQAHRNADKLEALANRNALLERALDNLETGILIVGECGELKLMNATAVRLVSVYFDRGPNGLLPDDLSRWCRSRTNPLLRSSDLPAPLEPLVIERDDHRLVIRLFPQTTETLLVLEEQRTKVTLKELQRLGLTPRQAEVLTYVAMGKTNPEIAIILGLSFRTVDKHLEQIFQRLSVENRTSAANLALTAIGSK